MRRRSPKRRANPATSVDICYERSTANCERLASALRELHVRAAALDDLIRMKRAAGRPKDLVAIELLEAVKAERESST